MPSAEAMDSFPISIHAPAQGATRSSRTLQLIASISIHAPAQGATWAWPKATSWRLFQFTPPRRGRLRPASTLLNAALFQFTPPRRGRQNGRSRNSSCRDFNSRPRAGGDRKLFEYRGCRYYFNSRPRAGGDQLAEPRRHRHQISIHAPAQGATRPASTLLNAALFQFTPPRRGRPQNRTKAACSVCSKKQKTQSKSHAAALAGCQNDGKLYK